MSSRATTAVILARGLGTRMRAVEGGEVALTPEQQTAAAAGQKGLMPVGGHPLLDHVLHELANGGVTDVVFVVAPGDASLRDRYERASPPRRLRVRFAEQREPRGTADALLAARDAVGDAPFLMLNADNLYPAESVATLVALDGPGLVAFDADALVSLGGIPAERVLQFALLDLAADGTLREVFEKPAPDHPLARAHERWVSMNLWRFDRSILDDCAAVRPSARGELELADAVRAAIARGVRFRAVRQRAAVLDLSRRGDVAGVSARLKSKVPAP